MGGGQRNSSIELLRIIAMFMILMCHVIVHNGYDVLKLPLGPERIFFQLVMAGGGKIGVVIFFSISAWFFLDKEQTIKSNLQRVWIMERELLFWSLILVTFYLVFDRADLSMKLMVKSVMPLSMGVWWYATAYAIFLALLPFLAKGPKALGREYHLALATTVLVIWGLTSFIPGMIKIKAFRCLWWVVWVRGDAGRVGWRHGCLSPVHRRASVAVTLEGGVRGLP
ncbi:acyltransferase [Bifidobacterium longum]|uniref:acyltransferase n=1 Tax=Bifidobacterium longum TaxID=216816 RepID=UPI00312C8EEC